LGKGQHPVSATILTVRRSCGLPIVHSTVNVKSGLNKPPISPLRKALAGIPTYDRSTKPAAPWASSFPTTAIEPSR
jgi:hypothetical protein